MLCMNKKLKPNGYALLFTIVYFVSYLTRVNFGGVVSEVVRDTGMSRSLLSMALTGSFITYGAGQLVSGVLGDKFSPKKLITIGLCVSSLMNLCIPLCSNHIQMTVVWCMNGFAQSFMWPPLVKLMTMHFSGDAYKSASVKVAWGSSLGTVAVYLFSPVLISLWSWRAVFVGAAICGIVMIVFWNLLCSEGNPVPVISKEKTNRSDKKNNKYVFSAAMLCIMFAIMLQGMLRDGVTTWMPSFISETYNLSSVIGILTGVAMPLFSVISIAAASRLYRKYFSNPVLCSGVIFTVAAVSALGLVVFNGSTAACSVFFAAVLTGCMHGINLILNGMIPPYFKKYGNVSTVSGILNACAYIGSASSTYGIVVLAEKFGWSFTLKVWFGIAVLGSVACYLCTKPWKRQTEKMGTLSI